VGDFSLGDTMFVRRFAEMFTDDPYCAHAAGGIAACAVRARNGHHAEWSTRHFTISLPLNRLREILHQVHRLIGVTFDVIRTSRTVHTTSGTGKASWRRIKVYIFIAHPH